MPRISAVLGIRPERAAELWKQMQINFNSNSMNEIIIGAQKIPFQNESERDFVMLAVGRFLMAEDIKKFMSGQMNLICRTCGNSLGEKDLRP